MKRKSLFERWFKTYNDGSIQKYEASIETEDYMLYVLLYVHKDNPKKQILVEAFHELIENELYPIN